MRRVHHLVFVVQCPCPDDDCYGTLDPELSNIDGVWESAREMHEFWTHDYEGEMDVCTGTIEF